MTLKSCLIIIKFRHSCLYMVTLNRLLSIFDGKLNLLKDLVFME